MKRPFLKLVAMCMAVLLILVLTPSSAWAGSFAYVSISGTITWHGGDPSAIAILVNSRNALGGYDNNLIVYNNERYNDGYPQLYLSPATYQGNGEWTLDYTLNLSESDHSGDPFVGLSESSLSGKWYCDKWATNNLIYQPGQYAQYQSSTTAFGDPLLMYKADFFLTNSESATKTITFNRTFDSGAPAVDATLGLYRYYSISDRYELINTFDMPGIASNIKFNTLYSGQYAIKQTLPVHYFDNASAACDGITGVCFHADLTSAASASLSATNSKERQKTITVGTLTGGTLTPNVTQAYTGDTVSLTVTPDDNRRLKAGTLKYTDGTGDHMISGTSFVMPGSDVTISAQFEPTHRISVDTLTGGTITPNVFQAFPGDTVSLTVTPDTDKQLTAGTLHYTDGAGDHAISGTSFVMPESDVTVSAEFEPKQYTVSVAALTGGSITPDKTTAVSDETVGLTVSADAGKQMKPGTLVYADDSGSHAITGASFMMPQSDVVISAQFEIPVSITTDTLPEGMRGNAYSASVSAQDGSPGYVWSAEGLPDGIAIDGSTGAISGIPAEAGSFDVELTVTDAGGTQAQKTLSIYINDRCGNGAYLIFPVASSNYTAGTADGGLPVMTVNAGITGYRNFFVTIRPEAGHAGLETLLFVQMRGGKQIGLASVTADFDSITQGCSGFNVKPGDVIKAYVVDGLSSDPEVNPAVL